MGPINAGDTAWVLMASALVLLMTPGLALFYGGMVRQECAQHDDDELPGHRRRHHHLAALRLLAGVRHRSGRGLLGGLEFLGLRDTVNVAVGPEGARIPMLALVMFQLTFAIITAALLSGAVADRVRTRAWVIFIAAWTMVVYLPIAHWAFFFDSGAGGWIGDRLGALDFAGGTAVEINSGFSSLALALVVGRRIGWRHDPMRPHNLPLVLLGAGLLWFGWFGFNAGSALAASGLAATAMINTQIATATAAISWVLVERYRDGKATSLGIASGAVAGAVAITPACGFVAPLGALAIGLVAGAVCALAVSLKYRLGYDDSLDVLGVHGVGGLVGMVAIGLVATTAVNSAGADGLLYGGGVLLLGKQLLAAVVTLIYAFGVTWLLATLVDRTVGFRITPEAERGGIDLAEHAESAYDITGGSGGTFAGISHHTLGQED